MKRVDDFFDELDCPYALVSLKTIALSLFRADHRGQNTWILGESGISDDHVVLWNLVE